MIITEKISMLRLQARIKNNKFNLSVIALMIVHDDEKFKKGMGCTTVSDYNKSLLFAVCAHFVKRSAPYSFAAISILNCH